MAKSRLKRYLSIAWDRDASRRLQTEAEDALERAGKLGSDALEEELKEGGRKGARALTTSLQREYKLRMARAQTDLAEGLIDEKKFRKEGEQAAVEFNRGLTAGIRKLQSSTGGLTDSQFAGLGSRFKRTGGGGMGGSLGLGVIGRGAGLFGGYLTATAALGEVRTMTEAADELTNSVQKLGGTAKITGIDLGFLQATAEGASAEFRLSVPVANDLSTEVAKLTSKAGEIEQTSAALGSFLDIGAARGMTAAETLQAVGQSLLGIDEGTDKLFGKNPSAIYDEWAKAIGRTGTSLSDQEKAQALLDAALRAGEQTRGSYLAWTETTAGKSAEAAMRIRELQAEAGKAIAPFRELALEMKVGIYEVLGGIIERLGRVRFNSMGKLYLLPPIDPDTARLLRQVEAANQRNAAPPPVVTPGGPAQPTAPEKAAAEARVTAMYTHLDQWMRSQSHFDLMTRLLTGAPDGGAVMDLETKSGEQTPFQQYLAMFPRIQQAAEDAAAGVSDAFQDTFSLMIDEGITVGNFFEGLGRSIGGAMLGAVAQFAKGEAAKHFASAIGAGAYALNFTALGNFASASAAWASAAQHTAAGAAFSAIAGAGAAGQGAIRTRGPSSTYDAGLSTAERAERDTRPIIININPFDLTNPVHAKQIGQGLALDVRLNGRPGWVR